MDDAALKVLVSEAGLGKIWQDFRHDLFAAARQVEDQRKTLAGGTAPVLDPWPPMTVPVRYD